MLLVSKKVHSRGYKRSRERHVPSLMERSKGHQELGCCLTVPCVLEMIGPFSGVPCPPFYRPRGEQGLQTGERGKNQRQRRSFEGAGSSFSPVPTLLIMADHVRDGMFTDPYGAIPWFLSASGCVTSYGGGWCGVLESRAVTLRGVDGEVTIRPSP